MGKKRKVRGRINQYLRIPIYWVIFWAVVVGICYTINRGTGMIIGIAAFLYMLISATIYLKFKPGLKRKLVDFGTEYSLVQRQMLKELETPYGLTDEKGRVLWTNYAMDTLVDGHMKGKYITDIFATMSPDLLNFEESDRNEEQIVCEDRIFRVVLRQFTLKEVVDDDHMFWDFGAGTLISVYFFDETQIEQLTKETKDEKLVVANLYIDNYDEVLQNIEPTRRTLLVALIDRRINVYFSQYDGIVRKLENDKYFVMLKTQYISKMQTDKFSVLDEVKNVNIGTNVPVTISIGIGMGGRTLQESYELSGIAIDMALARGGDQAVLKDGNKVYYYGGKSKSVQKNTKVKSRVKATAFRDLIDTKSEIYIMGHQIGDNDSFGAAIGLYRICRTIGKTAHLVIGEMAGSVVELVNLFRDADEYDDDLFLSGQEALNRLEKNDALIVVDVNRVGYTEYPELVKRTECAIVFDHHRQTVDDIGHAQLSYVEPSASSTCEMVVEIMQYISETVRLTKLEAEALYSGIMIDTNNFTDRTGVRTFEAAAYLRKSGADISRVRRMFRDDMADYKAKALAIQNTEIFLDEFALSTYLPTGTEVSPTVIGAQAANELLNVKNIQASFVLTPYNDYVFISARSLGSINVQVIMEEFGGGGHMNLAGAQIKDMTVQEVMKTLKDIIKRKIEEGDL